MIQNLIVTILFLKILLWAYKFFTVDIISAPVDIISVPVDIISVPVDIISVFL